MDAPDGIHYHWALKGSCRSEHMLITIRNLPNTFNIFSHAGYPIYVLDDYAVHLMTKIRKALWKWGYTLVIIGGGITGFVQVNDMHLHKELKKEYRKLESAKMLEKLAEDRNKIPSPTRSEMMSIVIQANDALKIDKTSAFKSVWVLNALDGSENYLISNRIMRLVGTSVQAFREELMSKPCPTTIKEVIKDIIPPKGVKWINNVEGLELFDGDVDDGEPGQSESENEEGERIFDMDVLQNIPIELEVQPPEQRMIGNTVALAGISQNVEVNKDAIFLDRMQNIFDECDRSTLFLPFRNRLVTTVSKA